MQRNLTNQLKNIKQKRQPTIRADRKMKNWLTKSEAKKMIKRIEGHIVVLNNRVNNPLHSEDTKEVANKTITEYKGVILYIKTRYSI